MMTTATNGNARGGFSLIELVVSMFAGSLVTGAIMTLLLGQMELSSTQNRNIINQQNLRETLAYMKEEISLAGSAVNEPYFTTATATELIFIGDIDGDGSWNRVRYFVDGADLKRTLSNSTNSGGSWTTVSTDVLAAGVESVDFDYFQPGNTATTVPADITSVEIRLVQDVTLNTTAITDGKVAEQEMVTRVSIRNRML
jgi:type II secretory pathway pseudopilin PulG